MATKTGSTYISGTAADRMTVLAAHYWFSTSSSLQKLTLGDCDKDRQSEMDVLLASLAISQLFLAVGRCRNHLANLLSSSTSSKILNMPLEFRRYLSEFQRCNYFRFGGHIDISGCRSLLYLPPNSISGFGRHFRLSLIIGIA